MTVYTFSAARQRLAALLEEAQQQGGVRIKRRDGTEFDVSPVRPRRSPLDVEGVPLGLRADEIVSALREVRSRGEAAANPDPEKPSPGAP